MSIIGAVGMGLALGAKASGFLFNYTKNEYEEKISELQGYVTELEGHLSDMESLKGRISNFWADDNALSVHRELERTIDETRKQMKTAKETMDTLKIVVDELDKSKGEITDTLEKLKALIDIGSNC